MRAIWAAYLIDAIAQHTAARLNPDIRSEWGDQATNMGITQQKTECYVCTSIVYIIHTVLLYSEHQT